MLYIGAGTYREVVNIGMTSPVAETKVIGDVDGAKTGDAGEVRWTAYTTNDTTAPSSSALLNLSGRDYLTFERIVMVGGSCASYANVIRADTAESKNITFRDCLILSNSGVDQRAIYQTTTFETPANWLIERCVIRATASNAGLSLVLGGGTGSDYDAGIVIRNCVFIGSYLAVAVSSASTNRGGGVQIYNCLMFGDGSNNSITTTTTSATVPCLVRNCYVYGGLYAEASGQLTSDYNHICSVTTYTNVTPGANDKTNATYAQLFSLGSGFFWGSLPRPFGAPLSGSPWLGFGNDGTYTSSEDITGGPRPAGGASASKAIGAYERANTATKETSTVRTGSNAIKLTGPGYQDYELAVNAASTTISVYGRYDGTYTGTKPSMSVLNGTESGVSNATATMTGSANNWEQLSLNFTPTSAGLVTIRLLSSDTNGGGACFFDDFAVT